MVSSPTILAYGDGGRWGNWVDGGGSNLELIDPRGDNRLPANWGDSDETSKSAWSLLSFTGKLDLGMNNEAANALEITLQGAGECLLDDVGSFNTSLTGSLIANTNFESGTAGWTNYGTHELSSLESNTGGRLGGYNSTRSLHLRAVGRGDTGANRIRVPHTSTPATGTVHTISARARWLRGETNIVLRTHGNGLEVAGTLTAPTNLGSPGRINSRFLTNTGPAIYDVLHSPVLPQPGQLVRVSARVHDPDGVTNIVLRYRIDPSATLVSVPMNDAGTNADLLAGDGLYSAPIPAQAAGVMVAFRIEAADVFGANSRFPTAQVMYPGDTEQRECLVRFGEPSLDGSFGIERFWMTAATSNQWHTRLKIHNSPLDVTLVHNDSRVIYNAGALYSGSPYTALLVPTYTGPMARLCGYELAFPGDDRLMGSTETVLDWPIRDNTGQREQVAYWMAEQLGLRPNHRRFVHVVVNGVTAANRSLGGQDGARVYEDTQQPGGDFLEQWFNDKQNGELHKLDQWLEFTPPSTNYPGGIGPTLGVFNTTNNFKKVARYRWVFPKRGGDAQAHNYHSLFKLVDAVNTNASYTVSVTNILDVEQWMRVWVLEDVIANADAFGNGVGGKNMFMYRPTTNDSWQLLLWDLDFGLGDSLSANKTNDVPFSSGLDDPINYRMVTNAPFQRAYWRGIKDAVNGPMQSSNYTAVLDGHYAALNANGIAVKTPTESAGGNLSLVGWIEARRNYLSNQLNTVAAPFSITNATTSSQFNIVLGGKAPVEIAYIRISGRATNELASWNTVTNWSYPYTLVTGANAITNIGLDRLSNPIATNGIVITKSP